MRAPIALVLVAGLAACTMREASPDAGPLPVVLVNVVNENLHDIDVYVVQGSARLRVARLWAGETGDVEIGPPLVDTGEFMLEAYALGLDASYRTPPIVLMGQMHIELRIEAELNSSTFSVSYGQDLDSVPPPTGETS